MDERSKFLEFIDEKIKNSESYEPSEHDILNCIVFTRNEFAKYFGDKFANKNFKENDMGVFTNVVAKKIKTELKYKIIYKLNVSTTDILNYNNFTKAIDYDSAIRQLERQYKKEFEGYALSQIECENLDFKNKSKPLNTHSMQAKKQCGVCDTKGMIPCPCNKKQRIMCTTCGGRGKVHDPNGPRKNSRKLCSTCIGKGYIECNCNGTWLIKCKKCNGHRFTSHILCSNANVVKKAVLDQIDGKNNADRNFATSLSGVLLECRVDDKVLECKEIKDISNNNEIGFEKSFEITNNLMQVEIQFNSGVSFKQIYLISKTKVYLIYHDPVKDIYETIKYQDKNSDKNIVDKFENLNILRFFTTLLVFAALAFSVPGFFSAMQKSEYFGFNFGNILSTETQNGLLEIRHFMFFLVPFGAGLFFCRQKIDFIINQIKPLKFSINRRIFTDLIGEILAFTILIMFAVYIQEFIVWYINYPGTTLDVLKLIFSWIWIGIKFIFVWIYKIFATIFHIIGALLNSKA